MGGLLSVALSRGSPRVAVSHRPALWSPDVPQPATALKARLLDQRAAVRLETSHLGQWASSHGAALVALESVLDNPTLVDLRPTS